MSVSLGKPDSVQLISAVKDFLRKDVATQLDPHTAFQLKIACNVLDIVAREIEQVDDLNEDSLKLLDSLLSTSNENDTLNDRYQDLCDAIRKGKIKVDDKETLSTLKHITLQQLAIDNPKYSGYQQATNKKV